jgi:hypothetical protein
MGDLQPRMRAGDADRSKVVDILGRHLGEGRLTVAEFDERTMQAHAAVYLDQLPGLLADLPGEPPPARPSPRPPRRRPQVPSVAVLLLVLLVLPWTIVAAAHGAPPVFAFVLLFLFLRTRRWNRRW